MGIRRIRIRMVRCPVCGEDVYEHILADGICPACMADELIEGTSGLLYAYLREYADDLREFITERSMAEQ